MSSRYPSSFPHGEFKCHLCGNCCRGNGFVDMKAEDVAAAAALLGVATEEFMATYCTVEWDGRVQLRDQDDEEQSCIFLNADNTCRIHAAKPQQCRDFPFKWRPRDIMDFCHGMRAAAGLPPDSGRRSVSDSRRRKK